MHPKLYYFQLGNCTLCLDLLCRCCHVPSLLVQVAVGGWSAADFRQCSDGCLVCLHLSTILLIFWCLDPGQDGKCPDVAMYSACWRKRLWRPLATLLISPALGLVLGAVSNVFCRVEGLVPHRGVGVQDTGLGRAKMEACKFCAGAPGCRVCTGVNFDWRLPFEVEADTGSGAETDTEGGRTQFTSCAGLVSEDSFIPPGCDDGEEYEDSTRYEDAMTRGHWVPPRLKGRNESLIEAVNDWHFAMLNDSHRNQFYWDALAAVVQGKRVIDIGSGSGLLSLMAAKLGASSVVAVEASQDMAELARLNAERNGQEDKIKILHALSSKVQLSEEARADVIVSETLGALMLGEGDAVAEALKLLLEDLQMLSPELRSLDEVREHHLPRSAAANDLRSSAGLCHGNFAWFLRCRPE
ncbi:PRMT7, partial [Symbiodinium microadriaticum]